MEASSTKPKTDVVKISAGNETKVDMMDLGYHVQINAHNFIQNRRTYLFRVTKVISPFEFYLELLLDGKEIERPGISYKDSTWFMEMQKFYHSYYNKRNYKIMDMYINRAYVYYVAETKVFERVRVLGVFSSNRRARIRFCDLGGDMPWVSWDDLLEMKPEFAVPNALAYQCRLANICPTDGAEKFSEEANNTFRELVAGRIHHTVVVSRDLHRVLPNFSETYLSMSVVLIRKDPLAKFPVQAELIKLGLAEGTGVMAGFNNMTDIPIPRDNFSQYDGWTD